MARIEDFAQPQIAGMESATVAEIRTPVGAVCRTHMGDFCKKERTTPLILGAFPSFAAFEMAARAQETAEDSAEQKWERVAALGPVQAHDRAGGVPDLTDPSVLRIPILDSFAIVDVDDYDLLKRYRWRLNSKGYAITSVSHLGEQRQVYMHRLLMMLNEGCSLVVDHINGDKLDNRIANLRVCTVAENLWNAKKREANSSGVKGVCWSKSAGMWRAKVRANGKKYENNFPRLEDAAAWVRAKRDALHGEFARHE